MHVYEKSRITSFSIIFHNKYFIIKKKQFPYENPFEKDSLQRIRLNSVKTKDLPRV